MFNKVVIEKIHAMQAEAFYDIEAFCASVLNKTTNGLSRHAALGFLCHCAHNFCVCPSVLNVLLGRHKSSTYRRKFYHHKRGCSQASNRT